MKIPTEAIRQWQLTEGLAATPSEAFAWVWRNWPELDTITSREITAHILRPLNQRIRQCPTGKRRQYQEARDTLLDYLASQLAWQLPAKQQQQQQWIDRHNRRFELAEQHRAAAEQLAIAHPKVVAQHLERHDTIPVEVVAVTLWLETAPLDLIALCYVINHAEAVEKTRPMTLCIPIHEHQEQQQWARYELSPLSACLLKQLKYDATPITPSQLKQAILNYLGQAPFFLELSYRQVRQLLRCHWLNRTNLWAASDLLAPERQHALAPERYAQLMAATETLSEKEAMQWDLFAPPQWGSPQKNAINSHPTPLGEECGFTAATTLIKLYRTQGKVATACYIAQHPTPPDSHNVVPAIFFDYVADFIQYGGPRQEHLATDSIKTYSALKTHLSQFPLSLSDSLDDDAITQWAQTLYQHAETPTLQTKVYRFLRYLATTPLGDGLAIEDFSSPFHRPAVDANLVSPREVRLIQQALDHQKGNTDPFQWLFARLALSLAFHGSLRRGEVLRLRIIDCESDSKDGPVTRIRITKTREGRPKGKKSRYVHLALPESDAFLLNMLLTLKKDCPDDEPLLGYGGETLSQRASRYLLPVTRAIKQICGPTARFHHLRHGGAMVVLVQAVRWCQPDARLPAIFQSAPHDFTPCACEERFRYWGEQGNQRYINTQRLLDEVSQMIGHESFATTRQHYLHGHEWLPGLFSPASQAFTKQTLRHCWGLPTESGDLSRRLQQLVANPTENEKIVIPASPKATTWILPVQRVLLATQQRADTWPWRQPPKKYDNETTAVGKQQFLYRLGRAGNTWGQFCMEYLKQQNLTSPTYPFDSWTSFSQLHNQLGWRFCTRSPITKRRANLLGNWLMAMTDENHCLALNINQRVGKQYRSLMSTPEFVVLKPRLTTGQQQLTSKQKACLDAHFHLEPLNLKPAKGNHRQPLSLTFGFPPELLIHVIKHYQTHYCLPTQGA